MPIPRSAVLVGGAALVAGAILFPLLAHEGHGQTAGPSFDPNAPKKVSAPTAEAIGLRTAEVDFGTVEDITRLAGVVQPLPGKVFAVSPRYAGIVRSVAVQAGDVVKTGDLLAEMDCPEVAKAQFEVQRFAVETQRLLAEGVRARAQVAALEIEGPAAARQADLAEAEAKRLTAAGASVAANILTQRSAEAIKLRTEAQLKAVALTQAKAEAQALEQQAAATRQAADALRATLPGTEGTEVLGDADHPGRVRFTASGGGVVVSRSAILGASLRAGDALLVVSDLKTVQVAGEVPESLAAQLAKAKGATVRIRLGRTGEVIGTGQTRFLEPVIDPIKRTTHLLVDVDNAKGLLMQGQAVDLAVVLARHEEAVVIPASALVKEGPLNYVFVKAGEGAEATYRKTDVAPGLRDDQIIEIKQGLAPGDVVVSGGAFSLSQLSGTAGADKKAAPEAADDHKHETHAH